MAADRPGPGETERRPARRRLRILLALTGLLVLLVVFAQLDPSVVRRRGPLGECRLDLVKTPADRALTLSGQRLVDELKEFGGHAVVIERTPGLFGLLGRKELFSISFPVRSTGREVAFGDEGLRRLVGRYGDRIWGLHLANTRVTDEGLRSLEGIPGLRHLTLGEEGPWDASRGPIPQTGRITDAGLAHLRDLKQLQSLHIRGLPITDAGLEHLSGLSGLHTLSLNRTEVRGPGLARLRSLPMLGDLDLSGTAVTAEGLGALAGLRSLGILSLDGVRLTAEGVARLKALPGLNNLSVRGCGLGDEQVTDLEASRPGIKIER